MKLVSLLLVLCMLLSFVACTGDPVDPVDTSDDSTTPEETTLPPETDDIHTGEVKYDVADYLPSETFDGEDIHIWIGGPEAFYNYPEDQLIEGDIVQAAVLERNAAVEDTYDVILDWDRDWNGGYRDQGVLRQSILAGDEYDILGDCGMYINPQILYGCFYDLAKNEYIDLTQPWYIEDATAQQAIYDKNYTAVGYFDFASIGLIQVYFFNDIMVTDYRLGNLYDVVEAGDWTWEKLLEYSEIVSEDVNQDGVYDTNDKYGLSTRWDYWISQPATIGYQYITLNENGEYIISGATDDLLEMSSKVYPFINGSNMHFSRYTRGVHASFSQAPDREGKTMFTNNQILFLQDELFLSGSQLLREFGDYGILPTPKFVEGQEEYGAASYTSVSGICSTTGHLKITSIVLEALQIESYNILRPAYINDALSYKYLSNPQAIDMLNLIFREMSSDWAYNFANAGIGLDLCFALPTQQYLASFFKTNTAAVEARLASFLEVVDAMP